MPNPDPPPNPALITALAQAIEHDPESVPLRLHLASLLLASEPSAALEHYAAALTREPANLDALEGAATAASEVGDRSRADAYRRLLGALGHPADGAGNPAAGPSAGGQESPAPPAGAAKQSVPADGEGPATPWWEAVEPGLTLAAVGGMEDVKRRIDLAFLAPLRNPALREAYGKSLRGGLLLYGPPGCGKTFLARAVAGELGARFLPIGLHDVLDMWFGESERRLHEIFESARRNSPCVVFFDELDAIGQKRSQLRVSAGRNVINQLLSELDGFSPNQGVFVMGATNHPWDVDVALLRPGRFDRLALVLPPDAPAREAILTYHLQGRPVAGLDVGALAGATEGFSGADLARLCEAASELAIERALATGTVAPIGMDEMKRAQRQMRPSTRSWFDTARNFVLFANEAGLYDDLLSYMRERRLL
ncbi:MAG: ATP-binding protein [Candidatus Dormibacteraeota bacterium]|nr:ATP-binding protein [Candidatus Dormibacteraeota bacterium]MDQ6921277.1 ATP-binding protein [Candidatus Dormibacteraeota bacterium]